MKGNSSDNCLVNLCNTRALANKQTVTMTDIATLGLKKNRKAIKKQLPEDVFQEKSSENLDKFYQKIPAPNSFF